MTGNVEARCPDSELSEINYIREVFCENSVLAVISLMDILPALVAIALPINIPRP